MGQVCMPYDQRARKNEKVILSALAETSQTVAATCMGVNESTISRMKGSDMKGSEIEQVSKLMAALGLKVIPVHYHCYPEEEIEALRILARRSDVLRADSLEWAD